MTISTALVKATFPGNATGAALNTGIHAFANSDILVYAVNATAGAIGPYSAFSVDILFENSAYTLSIGSPVPGLVTVTPLDPTNTFPVGIDWVIYRSTPKTQIVDYVGNDPFPVEAHERAMDKAALLSQELDFYRKRSIRVPEYDESDNMALVQLWYERANKLLAFDGLGNPSVVDVVTVTPLGIMMTAIGQTIAEAADADAVLAAILAVKNKGLVANVQTGTAAARAAIPAATFGTGFFLESDRGALWHSDGAAWAEQVIVQPVAASLPVAASRLAVATDRLQLYRGDGAAAQLVRSLPPRFLKRDDLSHSYCVKAAALTVQLNAPLYGRATLPSGSRDQLNWVHASNFSKTLGGTWAAGSGAAGLSTGTVTVGTWYHVFVLTRNDGAVEMGFDTLTDGSGLLANAAVIAAGYTHAQLVFSVRTQDTDAGTRVLIDWICEGNEVWWNQDLTLTEQDNNGTLNGIDWRDAAANQDYGAGVNRQLKRVPTGYRCSVFPMWFWAVTGGHWVMRPGGSVSSLVNNANPPNRWPWAGAGMSNGLANQAATFFQPMTNISGQILVTSEAVAANRQIWIGVLGYRHNLYG